MKHLKLFFALFAMLALGVGNAWAEEVTFDWNGSATATSGKTDYVVEQSPVTLTFALGTAQNAPRTNKEGSVRMYAGTTLTINCTSGNITKVVFTPTSNTYNATKLTYNGIALTSDEWTLPSPSNEVKLTASANARFKKIVVTYTQSSGGGDEPADVIVKTLKSIAVEGMTTEYEIGDVFEFDGTCTATYSVTQNGVPQEDETAVVVPTNVTEPDMSTAGTKEITVTYTEGEITKTVPYEITVENALPKIVITQNEVAEFTNTYAEYTWTASGVSGKIYGYKNSGMQFNSSKAGSYVYNTDPIPGYIRKIKIVKASGTTRNWTPYVSETALTSAEGTVLTQEEVATTTTWEVDGKNSYFYLLEEGGATVIESITISYEAVVPLVAAPTFDPIEGTYNSVQNVTISAEEGTTIHYTLDGQNPTTESPVYSTPIEIAETKTLKAIAVKDEKVSPIASAKYTINLPLTTMDQIFAKATAVGSTATSVAITFGNWVVSAVKEDGKTAFVTDGTKGFVIYDKDVNLGFSVGDILSGTAACKVQLYNGFAELTGLTSATTGLTVTPGGTITTQELDAAGIAALTGVNTGSLIKINGTCTSESSKYYVADVQIYTSLYDFGTLEVGAEYNITGIYQPYNATKEMLPRSAADIEKVVGLPTATISIADITMEIGQEKTIEATITPDAAQSTVQYAITSGNEYITLSGTTITAVAAGTATITATIAEKADEYKGATKEFTVTVKPQNIAELPFEFTGGKADIENTLGISQEGLGSDYTTAGVTTKLKFDGTGDWVIIHFNGQAEKLAYDIKGNSFSNGTFTVQQSADGSAYTEVVAHTELGDAATKEHELAAESRYVKFIYTEKSSGNVGLGNIKITEPDNRADAELAWNPETVTLTVGDAFTAPTFSNPNSLPVSFESSNTELATVTNAGAISLVSGKTGTATITATYAGDATYKAAEVTCVINVNPVTDEVVILAQHAGQWYAMKAEYVADKTDRLVALPVDYINGTLYNVADADKALITWERAVIGNKATFKNGDNYLKGKSSTTLIIEGETTGLYQWDYPSYTMVLEGSTTVRTFLYNSEYNCFRNYGASQASNGVAEDVDFSSVPVVTAPVYATGDAYGRTVTTGNYGTICIPYGSSNYKGAEFYEVAWVKMNEESMPTTLYLDQLEAGATLEAGKPYIFKATATEIAIIGDGTSVTTPIAGKNGLTGTFVNITAEDGILVNNYIIAQNQFWTATAENYLNAYRAYIVPSSIPTTEPAEIPGRRRIAMGAAGENEATGLDNITTTDTPVKVIVNGQLIIIREGVKYNVQGVRL